MASVSGFRGELAAAWATRGVGSSASSAPHTEARFPLRASASRTAYPANHGCTGTSHTPAPPLLLRPTAAPASSAPPSSTPAAAAAAAWTTRAAAAAVSVPALTADASDLPSGAAAVTYLEGNTWLAEVGGVRFLIDPVMEGPLDFGIPWLYKAFKRNLQGLRVNDVAEWADYLLLTQALDDHSHMNTLRPLAKIRPDIPIIATPNAQTILEPLFSNVTYLEPGQTGETKSKDGAGRATVTATAGPVLGPPWQRPENGYIMRSGSPGGASVYLEPHCGFDEEQLKRVEKVDAVITPVVKQELPAFTLVSGQEDAVRLVAALRGRFVVPMANGDLDASGILSALVQVGGTLESFQDLLKERLPEVEVQVPTAGVPVIIPPAAAS